MNLLTLDDFETAAQARLPGDIFAYIAGGAEREVSLTENRAVWGRIGLLPSHLRPLAQGSARAHLLGHDLAFPAMIAPMAYQRLTCEGGEAVMRIAAAAQGIGMILSCQTSVHIAEIARAAPPLWFQLYLQANALASALKLAQTAIAHGASALVVTIDAPINGLRLREQWAGFALPPDVRAVMLDDMPPLPALNEGQNLVFDGLMAHAPTWQDLADLCAASPVPVLAKGVLHAADARRAMDAGCRGIIVSNHGGRVLDGAPTPARMLPAIRAALPDTPILLDGGIRSGSDMFKAIALGADAILLGRPAVYGLAVGGAAGASHVIRRLRDEFEVTMALCGCRNISDITAECLVNGGAL